MSYWRKIFRDLYSMWYGVKLRDICGLYVAIFYYTGNDTDENIWHRISYCLKIKN